MGFSPKIIDEFTIQFDVNSNVDEILTVQSVETIKNYHDTYCFNEPLRHMGIFNGILTEQCTEITIYSDENEIGVCNLASICLPKFIINDNGVKRFDYNLLKKVSEKITINMNKVIKNNKYPVAQAKASDDKHAPIGIGVQGLADVFMILGEAYDSEVARQMNSDIFETIYFGALTASNNLAQLDGPYKSFKGSMLSNGIFQHNLWNNQSVSKKLNWNWDDLRWKIMSSGVANSLLLAQMPTAGTSIIMGLSESIEVLQSNLFTRSTLSGRFQVVNKHLMKELKSLGLWTQSVKNQLITNDGSVQNIPEIPDHIKNIFKTIYEYKISDLLQISADRERFICQASSNNRFIDSPTISILTQIHLRCYKLGLKTSSYYIRSKQITKGKKLLTTTKDDDICLSCTA
jgi:ribonucleoside-diphosphate reductase alpha chain